MIKKTRPMIAEVVYMDDQGIWHVLQLANMSDKVLVNLLEHEYGIRREWISEIQRKPAPKHSLDPVLTPEETMYNSCDFKNDRHCRRFLPQDEFDDSMLEENEY